MDDASEELPTTIIDVTDFDLDQMDALPSEALRRALSRVYYENLRESALYLTFKARI
ncbi:FxSxx-COOH cyclophane-containing RiPP peptide [Actinomadura sp. NPDC049753]|uniref:FxSxx-COOH cyclophane-containing RiPP peptide n=1 Tax=Actinomadura sp. NPDC049753 TaxID=3154739 RepID=UPI003432AF8D